MTLYEGNESGVSASQCRIASGITVADVFRLYLFWAKLWQRLPQCSSVILFKDLFEGWTFKMLQEQEWKSTQHI